MQNAQQPHEANGNHSRRCRERAFLEYFHQPHEANSDQSRQSRERFRAWRVRELSNRQCGGKEHKDYAEAFCKWGAENHTGANTIKKGGREENHSPRAWEKIEQKRKHGSVMLHGKAAFVTVR